VLLPQNRGNPSGHETKIRSFFASSDFRPARSLSRRYSLTSRDRNRSCFATWLFLADTDDPKSWDGSGYAVEIGFESRAFFLELIDDGLHGVYWHVRGFTIPFEEQTAAL